MPLGCDRAAAAGCCLPRANRLDDRRQARHGRNQHAAVNRKVRVRHTAQRPKVRAVRARRSPAGGGDVTPAVSAWFPFLQPRDLTEQPIAGCLLLAVAVA